MKPDSSTRHRALLHVAWCLVPCLVLAMAGVCLYGSTGRDDAHITYWSAHTLASTGEILNYNGDRVEQSSSLLHVVVLAALHATTGIELVTLGKLLSVFFGLLSVIGIFILVRRIGGVAAAFSAAMLTATSAYFVYWSFGGMESTLAAATGLTVTIAMARYCELAEPPRIAWPAVTIGLFALVRPEAPLVLGTALVGTLAGVLRKRDGIAAGRVLRLILVWALVTGCLVAFRLWYFGRPFPQPVTAKFAGLSLDTALSGVLYLINNTLVPFSLSVTVVTMAIIVSGVALFREQLKTPTSDSHLLFALLFVLANTASVGLAGGDWMEGGRLLVPVLPMTMGLIPLHIVSRTSRLQPLIVITLLLVAANVISVVRFTRLSTGVPLRSRAVLDQRYDASRYSWFERHSRINMRDVALTQYLDWVVTALEEKRRGPVVIMTGQMGMVPYHLAMRHPRSIRFVDRYGLTDRVVTDSPLAAHLERSSVGIAFSYATYFKHREALRDTSGVPEPDVIFDLRGSGEADAERDVSNHGYTIVFSQRGVLRAEPEWPGARALPAEVFIGVRADLVGLLKELAPDTVHLSR